MPLEKGADKNNKDEDQSPCHGKNVPIRLVTALCLALSELSIQTQKQCRLSSVVHPLDPPSILPAGRGTALKH